MNWGILIDVCYMIDGDGGGEVVHGDSSRIIMPPLVTRSPHSHNVTYITY
jgi:hypothetical protein